jgi:ribonucleoside-diphosphate reductase alpha chain
MGFQDCLHELRIPYASRRGRRVRRPLDGGGLLLRLLGLDRAGRERGRYSSYKGSLWDRGILPQGLAGPAGPAAWRLCGGGPLDMPRWTGTPCAAQIAHLGMRNSNCVAIAPTATISNIIGVDASIEPTYQNLYVKSNLSGEFTVVNDYLVRDLKRLGLWDDVMIADLKFFDGSLRASTACRRSCGPVRHRVRGRNHVAGRSRRAPPEVDRPGAVAEHLHGRRVGQEARRHLQAGLAARPEDHLLPAHAAPRTPRNPPCNRGRLNAVSSGRRAAGAHSSALDAAAAAAQSAADAKPATDIKFCAIDDPTARPASEAVHCRAPKSLARCNRTTKRR